MQIDFKYVDVLENILTYGYDYEDPNRKGVFRKELEQVNIKHLVQEGYPIITARKTYFKGAVGELLLFLKGKNDIRDYWDYGINFWDSDFKRFQKINYDFFRTLKNVYSENRTSRAAQEQYSMGKIYPIQYQKQLDVFDKFKENPLRTDLIINSWQIEDLKDMCLIPCHHSFQILGATDGFIINWSQRSTDFLLGSPINIQFYFLLGMLLELWSGHKFNGIIGNLNKVHLYDNQFKIADNMIKLSRNLYKNDVVVELEFDDKLKELPFKEFIKHIEPHNFKIKNYDFVLNEKVPMLTYNE